MTWKHDALAADLMDARHLAGEIAMERLNVGGGQIDVVSMRLSWAKPLPTGYEIKVSRADFLADVRAEKWRNYLPNVERLYFAVPRGLVHRKEVPMEAGLIIRGARGWHVVRGAPRQPLEPVAHIRLLRALLFRHYPAPWRNDDPYTRHLFIAEAKSRTEEVA